MARLYMLLAAVLCCSTSVDARRLAQQPGSKFDSRPLTVIDAAMNTGANNFVARAVASNDDMLRVLSGDGPFTLFAPTDTAFASLGLPFEQLLSSSQLTASLAYHVVPGIFLSGDLEDGQQLMTLYGEPLNVAVNSEGIFINGVSQVIGQNILAGNGVMHVVDKVVMLPTAGETTANQAPVAATTPSTLPTTVFDVIRNTKSTTVLANAISMVPGISGGLSEEGPFTVFAPVNRAFAGLGLSQEELLSRPELGSNLAYHIVPGMYLISDLVDGQQLPTVNGAPLSVSITPGSISINGVAMVTEPNKPAGNGVVHVIDQVLLLPPAPEKASPVEEAAVIEEVAPMEAAAVVEEAAPVEEVIVIEEMTPVEEVAVIEEAAPVEEVVVVEEIMPTGEVAVIEESAPVEEVVVAEEIMPTGEMAVVEEAAPVEEVVVIEAVTPTEEMAVVEEATPAEDEVIIEEGAPVEEVLVIEEAAPVVEDVVIMATEVSQPEEPVSAEEVTALSEKPVMKSNTIVDVVANSGTTNALLAVIRSTNSEADLSEEGPFTVFGFSDQVFMNSLVTLGLTAQELLESPDLTNILTYHVVRGLYGSSDLSDGQELMTVNGQPLRVTVNSGSIFVDDALIVGADQQADNGVLHMINRVLLPGAVDVTPRGSASVEEAESAVDQTVTVGESSATVEQAAAAAEETQREGASIPANIVEASIDSGVTNFVAVAINADAELTSQLSAEGPFTLFAPSDIAIRSLGGVDYLQNPELTDLIKYHVVPGAMFSNSLLDGEELITAHGAPLTVTRNATGTFINGVATFVSADIAAGNGVMHIIDTVLMPPVNVSEAVPVAPIKELSSLAVVDSNGGIPAEETVVAEEEISTAASGEPGVPTTVLDIVKDSDAAKTLTAAIYATMVDSILSSQYDSYTLFAPTDMAFSALDISNAELLGNTEMLTKALMNHLVLGPVLLSDLIDGQQLPTVGDAPLNVTVNSTGVFLNNTAMIVDADIVASNGVVHFIDAVLAVYPIKDEAEVAEDATNDQKVTADEVSFVERPAEYCAWKCEDGHAPYVGDYCNMSRSVCTEQCKSQWCTTSSNAV